MTSRLLVADLASRVLERLSEPPEMKSGPEPLLLAERKQRDCRAWEVVSVVEGRQRVCCSRRPWLLPVQARPWSSP
jgi:hypothetical protein